MKDHDDRIRADNDKGLNIRRKACERCLFGDHPHIAWDPYGYEKIQDIRTQESFFTCHEYQNVMCRGFYDSYGHGLWYVKLAEKRNLINWV